ncbi:hypothetical protein [Kitasatospora cineracea]|uniref:Uncharacterized protein n=1 Tax=Kitasatospora cineracea TaxID=88074 RepID=A0A3N4R9F1_9ACTN|nr:hypothetical protein [Kitasatospora cineracea]RPE27241.1 hypothetical protein EDD38_7385 [Kitasatospora cineracea]RPE27373.1 hypothetical protein EDD38_7518 [Kitasatospora cineracea]
MSELEDLRARVKQLQLELDIVRTVPALPAEHRGQPITWRRWEPAPVILCERSGDLNGCDQCDHPGPSLLAFGLAAPAGQPERPPVIRFHAHRCPGCQEMHVYERSHTPRHIGAVTEEIAYCPPQSSTAQEGTDS